MPQTTQKNVTSGGKGVNGTRGLNGTRGRSTSKGRSGTKGRSGSKGNRGSKSRSGSRRRRASNGAAANVPLAVGLSLKSVRALPSLTYNNYFDEQHYDQALVRTPGGTFIANYHIEGPPSPPHLPRYPSSSSSSLISSPSNLSNSNSENMQAAGRFNRVYPPVRTRSEGREEYPIPRRRGPPLGTRASL